DASTLRPSSVWCHAPLERSPLAGPFFHAFGICGDRLFELRHPPLAPPESEQRIAKIVLGRGPVERHALAGPFFQRLAIGSDPLFELRRPALALPESGKRVA